jgi:hypothetical protein
VRARRRGDKTTSNVDIHGESRVVGAQFGGLSCARRPVIDSVDGRILQSRLKPLRVFPQIMKQAGEFGFVDKRQRLSELLREIGNLAKVKHKRLPFTGSFRQAIAVFIFRRLCVVIHPWAAVWLSRVGSLRGYR